MPRACQKRGCRCHGVGGEVWRSGSGVGAGGEGGGAWWVGRGDGVWRAECFSADGLRRGVWIMR